MTGEPKNFQRLEVPASIVREVLIGRSSGAPCDPRGLTISRAKVSGCLDLDHLELKAPLRLTDCDLMGGLTFRGGKIAGDLDFTNSRLATIEVSGARINGNLVASKARVGVAGNLGNCLNGENMVVDGYVLLDDGFRAKGTVRLSGARISGSLIMRGAQVANPDGVSLNAEGIEVGGDVFLDQKNLQQRFHATGTVRVGLARITGQLSLRGARVEGPLEGESLNADTIKVHHVLLDDFCAEGTVKLSGAQITGDLSMARAQIAGAGAGESVRADAIHVDGAVHGQEFVADGPVDLIGAQITGDLVLSGAKLKGDTKAGYSLIGRRMKVGGTAYLDTERESVREFQSAGAIGLAGASVSRVIARLSDVHLPEVSVPAGGPVAPAALELDGATLKELRLDIRIVEGPAQAAPGPSRQTTNESSSDIGTKSQSSADTVDRRQLVSLDRCTYTNRPEDKLGNVEDWINLLLNQTPAYQATAYQQLAAVHRAAGHERDAGTILMAQQDHRRATVLRYREPTGSTASKSRWHQAWERTGLFLHRTTLAVSKLLIGYGHRPLRAVASLLVLMSLSFGLAWLVTHTPDGATGIPVARRPIDGQPLSGASCSTGETVGLALRIAVPLVNNLGQGTCAINTSTTSGGTYATIAFALQAFAWILGGLVVAAAAQSWRRRA